MSSRRLDNARINNFLKPWLDEKSSHYTFLNKITTTIVIDAAQKGTNANDLQSKLLRFCGDDNEKKKLSHFIKKYDKKIDKFLKKEVKQFKIESKPPQRPQGVINQDFNKKGGDKYRPQSENRNSFQNKSKPPFQQYQRQQHQQKQPFQNRYPSPGSGSFAQTNKPPPPPPNTSKKVALPAFYLDSAAISLRHADQKVKPLRFNDEGQRIDEEGNVIKTEFVRRTNVVTPKSKKKEAELIDKRIPTVIKPSNREFKFIEPGIISAQIEEKRKEAEVDLSVASGCNIFDTIALARNFEKPDIDWWDKPFINIDEETNEWTPNYEGVNNEYENATLIPSPQVKEIQVPTVSTEKERKRLKHINKLERQKEQRLMERLNLVPREPQRIRQSQMINFNQGKAVLAPTEVEMQAKAAKEYRIQKHEEHNAKAKLTPEQRSAKNDDKRRKDFEENDINITVFIVDESVNKPLNSDKLNKMATKWWMKGGIFKIKAPPLNFIVIEGGPKATRKYSRLVLNRVEWEFWPAKVVFQGAITGKTHFYNFKTYMFNIRTECRRFMEKYRADEFFDAAAREYPDSAGEVHNVNDETEPAADINADNNE
ncbi:hypothetical protein M9Y10_034506 [Tritrichomonas musculus]|uniref:Uncharacterized protein n=1 Tax=Tritrichomonas musculus TaxID=1915356 RepID=A0ABR2KFV5_9EUKA